MSWTQTSATCASVYGALDDLQQLPNLTTFENAGPLTMQGLQFYDPLASGDLNNASALALAKVMESTLANTYAGTYKTGFDRNRAITTINTVLQTATRTVENLSDVVNTIYTF